MALAPQAESLAGNEPLRLVSVCLDIDTQNLVRLFAESSLLVRVTRQVHDYHSEEFESAPEWSIEAAPDICLIDFDQDRQQAVSAAERILSRSPETAIFAISSQAEPNCIIEAMRAGCTEYLLKPVDKDQMVGAIARVVGRKKEKKEMFKAQVFAFMGAKGGCGVTTVATHLATLLAKVCERKTLLIDLHSDCGDVPLYLGLTKYRFHFYDLLENADRLDAELLHSFIMHHPSGLDIIPAPEETAPSRNTDERALLRTLDFLRGRYEFILVDLPPTLTSQSQELVRHADHLHLVTVAEVSALRNVVRHLTYFAESERSKSVRVVLNRFHKNNAITDAQIEKTIKQEIYWKVPNQYSHVSKAIMAGDPSSQIAGSDVARSVKDWAVTVGAQPKDPKDKKGARGILGLWNR